MHLKFSTVSRLANGLAASACVAALVSVPLFFNLHSERIFEEEKVALLRSLTLVALVALLIRGLEEGRRAWRVADEPLWRLPIVRPALWLAAAYVLATIFSIVPHASLWGAYVRAQGTYTFCSYLIVFGTIVLVVRRREQVESVITLIVIASIPVCVYALVQHFGYDPVRWGTDVTERVHAGAGNPIFLGAYLIMLVPLTMVRLLQAAQGRSREPRSRATLLLVATYIVVLLLQLVAIVYTQSRGPVLGLAAGMFFFVVLAAVAQRARRTLWGVLISALAVLALLAILNVKDGPFAPLARIPYLGRLGQVFAAQEGSGRVRVLVWEGTVDLLGSDPWRLLIGRGPETMYVAYQRFYPPALAHHEKRSTVPDRAHNAVFDALVSTGVIGLAAEIAVIVAFFVLMLAPFGLFRTAGDAQRCAFVVVTAGLLACLGVVLIDGHFRFLGVALSGGLLAGLLGYVVVGSLRQPAAPASLPGGLLWIGVFAAIIAHLVEIQVGIPVVATRLYFWAAMGLAVALGRMPNAVEPVSPSRSQGRIVYLAVMVGLILNVVTFDLYRPALLRSAMILVPVCVGLSAWMLAAILVLGHTGERANLRELVMRFAVFAAASFACCIPFLTIYPAWLRWRPTTQLSVTLEQALQISRNQSNATTLLYVAVFAVVALAAVLQGWSNREGRPATHRPVWQLPLYPALLAATVPVIVLTNLNMSRADIFSHHGAFFERKQKWAAAAAMYEQALVLQPQQDRYVLNLGRALVESAERAGRAQPALRDGALKRAELALQRAHVSSPLDVDHVRNLARLHRVWAGLIDDPTEQTRHRDKADGLYDEATRLAPTTPSIWDEWAQLHLERRDLPQALAKLGQSLRIDQFNVTSYWIRAHIYLDQGRLNDALTDFDKAVAGDGRSIPALTGKAMVLSRMGRIDESIALTQRVLQIDPDNAAAERNLALLYGQTGKTDLALQHAQAALKNAQPDEKAKLEEFIKALETSRRDGS